MIEARPGSGKTTLARRLAERLLQSGVTVAGFTSDEIREHGRRVGFVVEAVGGGRAVLAHRDHASEFKVGRYGVDIVAFERVALPSLATPGSSTVVVIDELGKMELASAAFCDKVESLFDEDVPVVATIHAFSHPFTDGLKRRRDVELIRLSRSNRDDLVDALTSRLVGAF